MKKRRRKGLHPVGRSILPKTANGVKIDGRSAVGRRIKAVSYELAEQVPNSDTPLMQRRILAAAGLAVLAEQMSWDLAVGKDVDAEEFRKRDEAANRALQRLYGIGRNVGHPKASGAPASDVGPRARSLGAKFSKANGHLLT